LSEYVISSRANADSNSYHLVTEVGFEPTPPKIISPNNIYQLRVSQCYTREINYRYQNRWRWFSGSLDAMRKYNMDNIHVICRVHGNIGRSKLNLVTIHRVIETGHRRSTTCQEFMMNTFWCCNIIHQLFTELTAQRMVIENNKDAIVTFIENKYRSNEGLFVMGIIKGYQVHVNFKERIMGEMELRLDLAIGDSLISSYQLQKVLGKDLRPMPFAGTNRHQNQIKQREKDKLEFHKNFEKRQRAQTSSGWGENTKNRPTLGKKI